MGRYKNLFLSKDEYDRPKQDMPDRLDGMIEAISRHLKSSGKRYRAIPQKKCQILPSVI